MNAFSLISMKKVAYNGRIIMEHLLSSQGYAPYMIPTESADSNFATTCLNALRKIARLQLWLNDFRSLNACGGRCQSLNDACV